MPELLPLALTLHLLVLAPLVALGLHRAWLTWCWWRAPAPVRPPAPVEWPTVTVQLPVFNERYVVERLISAVAALDYPSQRLSIQVLDDSTDDTTDRARALVARLAADGLDIVHIHRRDRSGFKAGALAEGLRRTGSELVAIFDADFVPRPDFLRRLAPWFSDPRVGMVQARWGHLNAEASWLTRAQALLLDGHFAIEHAARDRAGRWFNFNGTAGLWRRRAIEDAGGWQADTLTEDLDLSYRAQLIGWRFVYDHEVVAPAEIPATIAAFKAQQHRWARGSVQTALKLLPMIWRSRASRGTRMEATFHLTANFAYPAVALMSALMPVGVLARAGVQLWPLDLGLLLLGTGSVALFYGAAITASVGGWRRLASIPLAMALGAGMSLSQSRAVWEGLRVRGGTFVRTPKRGDGQGPGYGVRLRGSGAGEACMAVWLVLGALWVLAPDTLAAAPFLALFAAGFAWVSYSTIRDRHARSVSPGRAAP